MTKIVSYIDQISPKVYNPSELYLKNVTSFIIATLMMINYIKYQHQKWTEKLRSYAPTKKNQDMLQEFLWELLSVALILKQWSKVSFVTEWHQVEWKSKMFTVRWTLITAQPSETISLVRAKRPTSNTSIMPTNFIHSSISKPSAWKLTSQYLG